jgi:hypothetical protein
MSHDGSMAHVGEQPLDVQDLPKVRWLLDTHLPPEGDPISCIAAALREARQIVGRDPETSQIKDRGKGDAWSGAMMYLVFCEQIGRCFHLVGARTPRKEHLRRALAQFGGFQDIDAQNLVTLRNHLAHNFTLVELAEGKKPGYSFALHGSADEPVVGRTGDVILVGLPALAIQIERTFLPNFIRALDENRLASHHQGGVDGVIRQYRFGVVR